MEENTAIEQQTQTSDSFLEGWDDNSAFDKVEADKPGTESEAQAEEQKQDATAEAPKQDEKAGSEEPKQESGWDIRYLGEDKHFGVSDITPEMIQKALNHDRVQEKWNEAKPVYEMFSEFAKQANMSVSDYATYLRQQAKIAKGVSEDAAKREVALEDREAAVKEKEEADAEKTAAKGREKAAEEERQAKIKADLEGFRAAFPNEYQNALKDPNFLPKSVWDEVKKGIPLSTAYAKHELANARKANAAQEQGRRNAERSTGSMRTAGAENTESDPFLKDW